MKARLLRILRKEAEKKIFAERYPYLRNGRFRVMQGNRCIKSCRYYTHALDFANKLRRAYILDKLQKLK